MKRVRRGFVAWMAILLLLLVATSLVVLGSSFGQEARRTTSSGQEAQLRQLLTAGASAAAQGQATVELPPELQSRGAAVTVTLDADSARVVAVLGGRRMSQVVRFAERDGKRIITEASLSD